MYIEIEQDRYWVVAPTPEEVAALKDIPRRKKFARRLPFWLLGIAIVVCLLSGAVIVALYGSKGGPWWTNVILVGLPLLIAIIALVYASRDDGPAPLKLLVSADRAFDLDTGYGWTFMNNVLFADDRHLSHSRQREVLRRADAALIDQFWLDELNRELLRRYDNGYGDPQKMLYEVLVRRARPIIENIEPYIRPLRAVQQAEDDEEDLRAKNAQAGKITETRRFLLEEGLLPEG